MEGIVTAVSLSAAYTFSKLAHDQIELLAGLGVKGDVHMGETVKHRSRVARDPSRPNLRQVHLIHSELFDELRDAGFEAFVSSAKNPSGTVMHRVAVGPLLKKADADEMTASIERGFDVSPQIVEMIP